MKDFQKCSLVVNMKMAVMISFSKRTGFLKLPEFFYSVISSQLTFIYHAMMSLISQTDTTFMSLDMNKPLNKAHCIEREAEHELKKQNFDKAEQKYKEAADMMEEALNQVLGSSMEAPLAIQLEKLREMKTVINIKRREAAQTENAGGIVTLTQHKNLPEDRNLVENQIAKTVDVTKQSRRASETNFAYEAGLNDHPSLPLTWQVVPKELLRMVNDRETDSLLQFLHTPVENDELSSSTSRRKVPKSNEEVIEQYKTRLTLLQRTAEVLIKALEDKEKENELLQQQLSEFQLENSELHEQLDMYERNQCYHGIHSVEETNDEEKLPTAMMASMLIDQPESYFEFNAKDVESELQDAAKDIAPLPTSNDPTAYRKHRHNSKSDCHSSVQYEDLDVGSNNEVSEAALNADLHEPGSTQLRMPSLAGLPPLSSVHYDIDANNDIIT